MCKDTPYAFFKVPKSVHATADRFLSGVVWTEFSGAMIAGSVR